MWVESVPFDCIDQSEVRLWNNYRKWAKSQLVLYTHQLLISKSRSSLAACQSLQSIRGNEVKSRTPDLRIVITWAFYRMTKERLSAQIWRHIREFSNFILGNVVRLQYYIEYLTDRVRESCRLSFLHQWSVMRKPTNHFCNVTNKTSTWGFVSGNQTLDYNSFSSVIKSVVTPMLLCHELVVVTKQLNRIYNKGLRMLPGTRSHAVTVVRQ